MTITKKLTSWLSNSSKSTDMTSGKILPILISFAMPIMIGNLFQQLYSMVDTAVVGRGVGSNALAAVGVTSPVTQLLLGLMIGMTSGMSVVIAQHFGSGDRQKTRNAITNGIILITGISAVITVSGIVLCRSLFRLINTPADIMDDAVLYSVITFAGTAAAAAYNYEAGVLRAFGNSVIPLLFLVLTSLLNVGLDLLFVLAFGWGVMGVAVATVISQLASALLCLWYMARKVPECQLSKSDWKWDGGMAVQHLKTGIPMAFFSSLLAVSFLVLQAALNSLGSGDVAAYTAGSKMDTLVYQVMGAFGTAISTFAAQNYGKGALDRVRLGVKKCLWVTVAISVGLTGVGKSVIPMAVGISEILTRAAVTYLLVYRIGFLGMTFASPACWFTSTLLCVICYAPMMKSAFKAQKKRLQAA